jgi:hypothetical protein
VDLGQNVNSQVGLQQNVKGHVGLQPVLRIRDVYPGSRILFFTHPGSRIQKQQQKREVKKN